MSPSQRAATERLADALRTWPAAFAPTGIMFETASLLRELLAEPQEATAADMKVYDAIAANYSQPQGEPVAWGVFVDDELFKPFNCKDEAVDWFQAQYNHGSRYDYLVLPLYAHPPQQRKPLKTAMEAEIECDCLVAWNASTYGHSAHDTVHPMFLSAFIRGYRAAERAHGITGEQE